MQRDTLKEDLQYIANYNLPYEQLKGRSVLVTGATGLIGTLLVRALLAIGDIKVIALVRDSEKAKKIYGDLIGNSLKLHIADIVDKIKIEDAVDYIFHCASITASKMMIENSEYSLFLLH